MKRRQTFTRRERLEICRFCACLSSPTLLSVIEELAKQGDGSKDHFIEIDGLSHYTVNLNLRYLKKYDFVLGSLVPETPYIVNYKKLESSKQLLDQFFDRLRSYQTPPVPVNRKKKGNSGD